MCAPERVGRRPRVRPALGAGWVQPWGPQLVLWSPALKRSEAIRLIYIWELKWNVSGLPLRLLCLVFMETCVYGETLSMLATDRCFCSLSVIMLRMFLLGEELPFFFPLTQIQKIERNYQHF